MAHTDDFRGFAFQGIMEACNLKSADSLAMYAGGIWSEM